MRLIGYLDKPEEARRFEDYLTAEGIKSLAELDGHRYALWIHTEEQIEAGQKALVEFQQNPNAEKYQSAGPAAQKAERKEREEQTRFEKRVKTADQIWSASSAPGVVSYGLIVFCVITTAVTYLRHDAAIEALFSISNYRFGHLSEVSHGQVWRLITPVFLHFGVMHLVFNVWWLHYLGAMIERRRGSWNFFMLFVFLAVVSNLGQYYMAGPAFGGMSGVNYGLLGYVWMRSRLDPNCGMYIDRTNLIISLVWFVLCFTGMFGDIANWAHTAGLVLGVVIGAMPGL